MSNWVENLEPLLSKYGKQKHPLNYNNRYELLVMIILSAQTTDSQVNKIAPEFFRAFPTMSELKNHSPEDLYKYISSIRGYMKKARWIVDIARAVRDDFGIPHTMDELTRLPGIGRKSANILIRESGDNAEGVVVDLHVARVAPRLGIADDDKPDRIERQIMDAIPGERWNETGMALSFHGRETCRPKPECERCPVNAVCNFYRNVVLNNNALFSV
jgi:endonuclease III